MQIPARRRVGLVEAGAVEPVAAAFGILDAVIVADLGIRFAGQPQEVEVFVAVKGNSA